MRKNASTFEGIFPKIRPLKRPHFTTPHSTILYQSQIAIIYFLAIFPKIIFQVLQQAPLRQQGAGHDQEAALLPPRR